MDSNNDPNIKNIERGETSAEFQTDTIRDMILPPTVTAPVAHESEGASSARISMDSNLPPTENNTNAETNNDESRDQNLPPIANDPPTQDSEVDDLLARMDNLWERRNERPGSTNPESLSAEEYDFWQQRYYEYTRRRSMHIRYGFSIFYKVWNIILYKEDERLVFQLDKRTLDLVKDGTVNEFENYGKNGQQWKETGYHAEYCSHNDCHVASLFLNDAFELSYKFKESTNTFEPYFCALCMQTFELHLFPEYAETIEGQQVFHVMNNYRSRHEQYVYDTDSCGFTQVYYPDHPFDEKKVVTTLIIGTVKDQHGMETMVCRDLEGKIRKWRKSGESDFEEIGVAPVKSMSRQKYEKFCQQVPSPNATVEDESDRPQENRPQED